MYVRFNRNGIKYLSLLATLGVINPELLLIEPRMIRDIPRADNLEAAAYLLSLENPSYEITADMLDRISYDEFEDIEIMELAKDIAMDLEDM